MWRVTEHLDSSSGTTSTYWRVWASEHLYSIAFKISDFTTSLSHSEGNITYVNCLKNLCYYINKDSFFQTPTSPWSTYCRLWERNDLCVMYKPSQTIWSRGLTQKSVSCVDSRAQASTDTWRKEKVLCDQVNLGTNLGELYFTFSCTEVLKSPA